MALVRLALLHLLISRNTQGKPHDRACIPGAPHVCLMNRLNE
jgi:hypothetical protein